MVQGDQLYMVECIWYLVTGLVHTCTVVYTGQVTYYKVPKKHGHVYLVGLYLINGKGEESGRKVQME